MSVSTKPLRELSLDDILSRAFTLYFSNFSQFILPYLIFGAISGVVTVTLEASVSIPATPPSTATPQEIMEWFTRFLPAVLTITVPSVIVSWLIGTVVQGIAMKFTADTLENKQATLLKSCKFTFSKILALLAASIITVIIIALGIVALVIPGILLAIMFSLVVPTIIIEGKGVFESLSRSRMLVSNRWLKTFGVLVMFQIIIGIAIMIITLITRPLGLVGVVAASILGAIVQPILPIGLTLHYYSMLAREVTTAVSPSAQIS
ncbi:MAG: hypothetical protein QXU99_02030 [Candidatus Bathyarchaeia archaeon]